MGKDSFIELCETYKKLLLEIIDISLFFDKCKDTCRKVGYRVKDGKVEFTTDKELEEVLYKLQRAGQSFRGYEMDSNKLVRNYSTMTEWISRIKETKGLQDPLDIQNAILEEMERREREKGLVLETPGGKGDKKIPLLGKETIQLKINGKTRDIEFDNKPYPLPTTPYKFLYALAKTPGKTISNKIFLDLTPRGTKEGKNISKHIQTIKDRIPPLKTLIHNKEGVGYWLDLKLEEVGIEEKDIDVERYLK